MLEVMRSCVIATSTSFLVGCFSPEDQAATGGSSDTGTASSSGTSAEGPTSADPPTTSLTAGPTSADDTTSTNGECSPPRLECDGACVDCPDDDGVNGVECSGSACVASGCADGFLRCGAGCCAWTVSNVEQSGEFSRDVDIVIDGSDRPHVVYAFSAGVMTPVVRHAFYDGFDWTMEDIDDASADAPYVDIDIGNGVPHVTYTPQAGSDNVGHAVHDGSAWVLTTVYEGSVANDYRGGQIAVDSTGSAHVTYRNETYMGEVFHAYFDGSWHTFAQVAGSLDLGLPQQSFSIAVAPNDAPHLAFYSQADAELGHAVKTAAILDPAGWSTTVADLGVIHSPSISVSPGGALQIAYYNETEGELRLATHDGAAWAREAIWTEGPSDHIALAHAGDDRPHVAFVDADGRLHHASLVDGAWVLSIVDEANTIDWVSIALDSADRPHIVLHDEGYGGIRYATAGSPR
jgi:hypothetical protein